MDAMDIIPSLGHRKRSWDEEEYEPSKKRTHTWMRDRPLVTELDYPIIQQVQNIALGNSALVNDVQMITDEPARQRPMFLPPSPISRPVSPQPAVHSTTTPPVNPAVNATPSMANVARPDPARPLGPTQVGSNTKKRFAIGPRADCEKCIAREPGHYGHWL
ncbi:unnamed protein product [Rhizoctonia solani]|uniref:Uncharacterized protein n=1 Tax=Rhizoctonia solani TaxID=456999 RepID=A0A8H3HBH6_9AGAM|nr:unnamed protein product [Rhizoctonia solani]